MDDFGLDGGTQFDFTYAPDTSIEQIVGFEMAGQIWSSYLDDDVTIRIYVESTDQLPEDVVGAALPGKKKKEDYNKVREKLIDDITSSDDGAAILSLPSADKEFSVVVDGQELTKTKEFKLTNANAKALDLLKDDAKKLDGYILVSDLTGQSSTGWDYDALRSSGGGGIDFLSVAMHEIGHVLGFVSGIDDDGWLEVLTEAQRKEEELEDKDFKFATPLDLFRYSDSDMAVGKIDLSTKGNPYFSIDGGESNLANFSSGAYTDFGGDGYQASHWKNGSGTGIMNPILSSGERKDISSLDLKAMDVIGWDINTSSLDWQQMYDDALLESESAVVLQDPKDVEKMEKNVEKMIKDSEYEGRRGRGSTSNYAWQFGFWQFTTLEDVATSEIPELVESIPDTEDTKPIESNVLQSSDASEEVVEIYSEEEPSDSLLSSSLNDDVAAEESSELTELTTNADDSILQPSDALGIELVSSDGEQQDPLLSGGLMEEL